MGLYQHFLVGYQQKWDYIDNFKDPLNKWGRLDSTFLLSFNL